MPLSRDAYLQRQRNKMLQFARSLLSGEGEFLLAIRNIAGLLPEIDAGEDAQDFAVFLLVDSESHHLPAGAAKSLYSRDWLRRAELEIQELEAFHRAAVAAACEQIIGKFAACACA